MAARLNRRHQDMVRDKIQASQLINRLTDHALGLIELSTTQIKAIEILLSKSLPSLTAIEHSGEIETKAPAEMTDAELVERIAGMRRGIAAPQTGAQEPPSVH
jgi:hypothetical protein